MKKVNRLVIKVLVVVLMIMAPLLTLLLCMEYYTVGIKKDIAEYPFGIEEAGGHYQTAETYTQYCLIQTLLFALITCFIYMAVLSKNKLWYAVAATILLIGAIVYSMDR